MKLTDIARRIDDMGRVMIPKEIRRSMNITRDDPFEIFEREGEIIMRRCEIDEEASEQLSKLVQHITSVPMPSKKRAVVLDLLAKTKNAINGI